MFGGARFGGCSDSRAKAFDNKFPNFFTHLKNNHPFELTDADQQSEEVGDHQRAGELPARLTPGRRPRDLRAH